MYLKVFIEELLNKSYNFSYRGGNYHKLNYKQIAGGLKDYIKQIQVFIKKDSKDD